MKTIVLNDIMVSKKIRAHEAEIAELEKKTTLEDAEALLPRFDMYEITKVLPKGTVAGKILRAKKQGVEQSYGFVDTSYGDIFVPPSMMADFQNNAKVAVVFERTPRGKVADRIANLDDYISWHRDEVLENIVKMIDADHAEKLRFLRNKDPSDGWYDMKDKCNALGLQLVEIFKEIKSLNYGGRGRDTYRFSTLITEEKASEVLDALGARHAEVVQSGSYDHGHDRITITVNGFHNDWCGPWDD